MVPRSQSAAMTVEESSTLDIVKSRGPKHTGFLPRSSDRLPPNIVNQTTIGMTQTTPQNILEENA
jgi:hypothetical protein